MTDPKPSDEFRKAYLEQPKRWKHHEYDVFMIRVRDELALLEGVPFLTELVKFLDAVMMGDTKRMKITSEALHWAISQWKLHQAQQASPSETKSA